MNAIVPRATIEEMVGHYNRSIDLYRAAWEKIVEAKEAVKAAHQATHPFKSEDRIKYGHGGGRCDEVDKFWKPIEDINEDTYRYVAERLTAIDFWEWVVSKGDLQRLMDSEAKEKLRSQLAYIPMKSKSGRDVIDEEEIAKSFPPVTVENVVATVQEFAGQADFIFRRGVANAFSKLDRRFRSHDGFKIGSRVILSWFSDSWGRVSQRNMEVLTDIERAFAVLDGCSGSSFTSMYYAVERARPRGLERSAFEAESAYARIKSYKNGNAHLWFTRDDLVRKVNLILAEYYGEVIGDQRNDGPTADDLFAKKSAPLAKRDFDLFASPADVVAKVIEAGALYRQKGEKTLSVLEPSGGTGAIAAAASGAGCTVHCVEIEQGRARALAERFKTVCGDFLRVQPADIGTFDRVLMNPPFTGERDIEHVMHAWKFVKPGGRLVAVMSAGTEFRETKKAEAFRELAEKFGKTRWNRNWCQDLPPGSFAEVGTWVNTILVTLDKPEV